MRHGLHGVPDARPAFAEWTGRVPPLGLRRRREQRFAAFVTSLGVVVEHWSAMHRMTAWTAQAKSALGIVATAVPTTTRPTRVYDAVALIRRSTSSQP
jgi:hypothetical protein